MNRIQSPNRSAARTAIASLLMVVLTSLGCADPPGGPGPGAFTYAVLAVTGVSPSRGLSGDAVSISGTGFLSGARVRLDGLAAMVNSVTSTLITATVPVHAAGTVDVVVTNTSGENTTLVGGYTYEVVSLTASSNPVKSGDPLSVSWVAPSGRSVLDWIGFFKVGDPSTSYENGWWKYTNGLTSGTLALTAPIQPGQYEFRYLVDDGFIEAGRSGQVTVTASAWSPASLSIPGARSRGK